MLLLSMDTNYLGIAIQNHQHNIDFELGDRRFIEAHLRNVVFLSMRNLQSKDAFILRKHQPNNPSLFKYFQPDKRRCFPNQM